MLYGLRRPLGIAASERDGWALPRRSSSVREGDESRENGVGLFVMALAENGGLFSICCTVLACISVS